MDEEDFLAAVEADNANVPVEEPKEEPAPLELTEEAPPAEEAATPPPAEPAAPEPQHAPITALLDERERRQKAEAELERLRASQPQQQLQAPDMFEDPDGYAAYQQNQAAANALNVKLDLSEDIARTTHGDELVDQAREWALKQFQSIPGFQAHVFGQRNPYGFVVREYQKAQIADTVTPQDYAEFQAWKQAQAQLQAQPPPSAAEPPPSRTAPPRSLASAPSAGGVLTEVEQSEEEIFEEVLPKR